MALGIVTGMAFEAAGFDTAAVFVAGADLARAEAGARQLIAGGARAILSFGVAGGLDPALGPGDVVVGEAILAEGAPALATDDAWRSAVLAALAGEGARQAPILSRAEPVLTRQDKARLFRETGAAAVDMESYGAARAAGEAGIPALAVRVVADPAGRTVPPAMFAAIAPDGGVRPLACLAAVVRDPAMLGTLTRLAGDTARARWRLRRVAGRDFAALLGL